MCGGVRTCGAQVQSDAADTSKQVPFFAAHTGMIVHVPTQIRHRNAQAVRGSPVPWLQAINTAISFLKGLFLFFYGGKRRNVLLRRKVQGAAGVHGACALPARGFVYSNFINNT